MSKIYAPNYTQTPNVIFDYWMKILSPAEYKVISFICRKTFGYHKIRDKISFNQIVNATGLCRRTVIYAIQTLIDHGLIKKEVSQDETDKNEINIYEIVLASDSESAKYAQGGSASDAPGVVHSMHQSTKKGSASDAPTKERVFKEKKTKQRGLAPHVAAFFQSLSLEEQAQLNDEKTLKSLERFSEDRLNLAISYSRKVKIDGTLIALLVWHCKQETPPVAKLSQQDRFSLNKEYVLSLREVQSDRAKFEILNKSCEIIPFANCEPRVFEYGNQAPDEFIRNLRAELESFGLEEAYCVGSC